MTSTMMWRAITIGASAMISANDDHVASEPAPAYMTNPPDAPLRGACTGAREAPRIRSPCYTVLDDVLNVRQAVDIQDNSDARHVS